MFKKPSLIVLFLLAFGLLLTYQNCAQVDGGLFNQSCEEDTCGPNPQNLSIAMDLNLVPGGVFKISTNPTAGFDNLRLTGSCSNGGYDKNIIKVKIYQCIGSSTSCEVLKHISSTSCGVNDTFEFAQSVTTLTPGSHKLLLEIVGLDKFGQEVYGPKSKLASIKMQAQQTIKAPVLATFAGTNEWAQDKIYVESTTTAPNKMVLDGRIQGFCDHNATVAPANAISVKLALRGSSTQTLLASTTCNPIAGNINAQNSPHRAGRTGYFQIDAFSIFFSYGQLLVTCNSADPDYLDCTNNAVNMWTNRIVALSFFQKDIAFDYDVSSTRNFLLHFKNINYGNGWLADALLETLKRLKKSFSFQNSEVSGRLDGSQSSMNDFTMAVKILTSPIELYDSTNATTYGFGTRAFITRWLLGANEDASAAEYTANNIYFLGTSTTVPYKRMAEGTICELNTSLADPIQGISAVQYSQDQGVERIAVCLAHRYLNGLWNRDHAMTRKMVTEGVTFLDATTCAYRNGGLIPVRDCGELLSLWAAVSAMKVRHLPSVGFSSATDAQLKYFGNGVTQAYINKVMLNLLYRNGVGENEYFAALFLKLYPEITDDVQRRSLYPDEINYVGATPAMRFYGTRTRQLPDGSYTH